MKVYGQCVADLDDGTELLSHELEMQILFLFLFCDLSFSILTRGQGKSTYYHGNQTMGYALSDMRAILKVKRAVMYSSIM